MFLADTKNGYRVLDTGDGMKLEDWNGYILSRPDPQVIWPKSKPEAWDAADAEYMRSSTGGGSWSFKKKLPDRWTTRIGGLDFYVRPTGFKHTGLFPEQAANWDFMKRTIRQSGRAEVNVLNLFAYTGGTTLACAKAGAAVTHVDAAKSMVMWAKENAELSKLGDAPIRYIVDDCMKFVEREQRRGRKYDGIVMDPPSYGRGSGGQIWKVEKDLFLLVNETAKLLSDDPLFFVINSYTTGLTAEVSSNLIRLAVKQEGFIDAGTLALPVEAGGIVLPCGTTARWHR